MKVMISGSSGLVGSALKYRLLKQGDEVIPLPRTYEKRIDFSGVDAVVHLAGESIAAGRWSAEKKKRIEDSRVIGTRQLSDQLAASSCQPNVFICASAIGFYGDRDNESLDESSEPGTGFLPDVCQKWENSTQSARDAGIRTVHIRTGIVLSSDGGALRKMLMPFKMGGGGIIGDGNQYMSWISLEDEVEIIRYLINHPDLSGPINLVAPNPVTNREFTKTLGKVLKRPTITPMPAFAARVLFGEMADALLLSSTRVYPEILVQSGYEFRHATLESALRSAIR
jgi:uncharacterized protein (TIGR01777 family)